MAADGDVNSVWLWFILGYKALCASFRAFQVMPCQRQKHGHVDVTLHSPAAICVHHLVWRA